VHDVVVRLQLDGLRRREAAGISGKPPNCPNVKPGIKRHTGRGNRVMLVQIDENSVTLTPFGSLIRISPVKASRGRFWTAKLRAVLALVFRS